MVGILFYFTARDENRIDLLSAKPDVVVDVTGFQWSWEFQYGQNSVDGVTQVGEMWNGKQGTAGNEGDLPLLEIPEHETVRFNLKSNDVIHSFWILPFDFKRDVLPDHPNHFQPPSTAVMTPSGAARRRLRATGRIVRIKIVTPAQFKAWISSQQSLQNAHQVLE